MGLSKSRNTTSVTPVPNTRLLFPPAGSALVVPLPPTGASAPRRFVSSPLLSGSPYAHGRVGTAATRPGHATATSPLPVPVVGARGVIYSLWEIKIVPLAYQCRTCVRYARHFHFHTCPRGVWGDLGPHSLTTPLPLLTEHQKVPPDSRPSLFWEDGGPEMASRSFQWSLGISKKILAAVLETNEPEGRMRTAIARDGVLPEIGAAMGKPCTRVGHSPLEAGILGDDQSRLARSYESYQTRLHGRLQELLSRDINIIIQRLDRVS
ncbi:hypothetical protein Bbelb_315000 [Branchiostoma belcheri]|nr:hypothetical protein Bbelb_315000 [Branchiostoma belcheri]